MVDTNQPIPSQNDPVCLNDGVHLSRRVAPREVAYLHVRPPSHPSNTHERVHVTKNLVRLFYESNGQYALLLLFLCDLV